MAIRIGEDGTIINGDEVISSSGTVIRDDGTIESSNIAVSNVPQRSYVPHAAPVSPLENGANRQAQPVETAPTPAGQPDRRMTTATTKSIADLEYDLMICPRRFMSSDISIRRYLDITRFDGLKINKLSKRSSKRR